MSIKILDRQQCIVLSKMLIERNVNKKYTVQIKKIGRSLLSDFEEEKLQ